jgi:hypothetical protein
MSPNLPNTQKRAVAAGLVMLTVAAGLAGALHALAAPAPPRPGVRPPAARPAKARPAPMLAISAHDPRRVVAAGATVAYLVRITRGARLVQPRGPGRSPLPNRIWLSASTPLASGLGATMLPHSTRASTVALTLRTTPGLRPGTYRVGLEARDRLSIDARHPVHTARTVVTLVVARARRSTSSIAGELHQLLAPGVSVPLDLRLTNRRGGPIAVVRLTVAVAAIRAPAADAAHPCTVGDFRVTQFSGAYGFRLPASGTRTLTALGIPAARWPRVTMLDRPVNQDGCKRASLTLAFTGEFTGPTR